MNDVTSPRKTRRPWRRTVKAAAGLAFIAAALITSQRAGAQDTIRVTLDQAQVLQLPAHASVVVLGNPVIADVTLLKKSHSMILTGKSFGETNLLALDDQGHTLGESIVRVVPAASTMIVQLGTSRQSYACDPHCQPTFELGDDSQYTAAISGQIQSRNSLAQSGSH
jgi:Flp pilus assembly secretin CpaC